MSTINYTPILPLNAVTYFDTIVILTRIRPTRRQIKAIANHSGSTFMTFSKHPVYRYRINVNQPALEVVDLLPNNLISKLQEVHVSLDILMNTQEEAHSIKYWLSERHVQPYRRTCPLHFVEDTYYNTRRNWQVKRATIYSDYPSKVTCTPCCHFELRFRGTEVCRRGKFESVDDVFRTDLQEWWYKNLCLEEVNIRQLGRQALRRGRAKRPLIKRVGSYTRDAELVAGHQICRACVAARNPFDEEQRVYSQLVVDHLRSIKWFRRKTAMSRLNVRSILNFMPPCDTPRMFCFPPPAIG